ncbi:16S rRNA (cytosine(1402)-N(4))-methyltransferase RsmH [candidate division FCPU426 bacterium]|nr:16S rRNA (cytosine(1402)-N(4))-methyltransferase RsmH [candidate division FCPU426 bacterium]
MTHQPVMMQESLMWLSPRPEGWWADCTVGDGGHTEALLQATAPAGKVIGLDKDREALARAQERLDPYGERVLLVQADFRDLHHVLKDRGIPGLSGALMDVGVSSFQLDNAARGFSFQKPGPLDMRMDRRQGLTAADIINHADEKELSEIFYRYGEERRSRQLARQIVKRRPLAHTGELAEIIRRTVGRPGRMHPATRVFQALRIAVNDELTGLQEGVKAARQALMTGGRLVVISFHSLEDRIVKEAFRSRGWERLTKKVVRPQADELGKNPRARSARLRAARAVEGV